jgi:hypothetical protein
MNIMLKTKKILPIPVNVYHGIKVNKRERENGAVSMTIIIAINNQRRRVHNQSESNNAFFFLII